MVWSFRLSDAALVAAAGREVLGARLKNPETT
jgi:hypothetical protein